MRLVFLVTLAACGRAYQGPLPAGEGAAVYGKIVSLLGDGIGDVQICVLDSPVPCVTTAGDGEFLIEGLPEDTDIIVTMVKSGHMPTAYHHNTSLDQEWLKTLMPNSLVNSMLNKADIEAEPGLGHAMFILWSGPDYDAFDRVADVSFEVDAEAGAVFYANGLGLPDPDLVATSGNGSGGAFNLAPGEVHLAFSGDGVTCERWFSHAFEPGEPVPIQVIPDFGSYVDLVCK